MTIGERIDNTISDALVAAGIGLRVVFTAAHHLFSAAWPARVERECRAYLAMRDVADVEPNQLPDELWVPRGPSPLVFAAGEDHSRAVHPVYRRLQEEFEAEHGEPLGERPDIYPEAIGRPGFIQSYSSFGAWYADGGPAEWVEPAERLTRNPETYRRLLGCVEDAAAPMDVSQKQPAGAGGVGPGIGEAEAADCPIHDPK
ncbi:hypothetical protein [Mycolicibacterium sphagni]|uniref:Uncharacterized protein n=1 Tax=Mycolicibacterium sphagni TaxID=1786 RepID=A0A255DBN4_9MYCO|nr:hypothetical protein [Mycolicibacterium sphagni]OYN76847.1 hypothetical protein CG716_20245 [Mycolicibacterium sphagni]